MPVSPLPQDITGCVLAGGRGTRMGGVDKGLQPFLGQPLAAHALQRLAPQVGSLLINANRHADRYAALGAPWNAAVWPDAEPDYPGPLAGFLCGLLHCQTEWLACVPCDTPLFPEDLVARMVRAVETTRGDADIVVAHGWEISPSAAPDATAEMRAQPVFCLLRASLRDSLQAFVQGGGRKIDTWTARHRCIAARFDRAGDRHAFANANTPGELRDLERHAQARMNSFLP
jgi:molybdopterin-guanine dinucleotide biosynthesis protein A